MDSRKIEIVSSHPQPLQEYKPVSPLERALSRFKTDRTRLSAPYNLHIANAFTLGFQAALVELMVQAKAEQDRAIAITDPEEKTQ